MTYDLLIKDGHLIDPAQSLDDRLDVAFSDGKVARVDKNIPADTAANTLIADGAYVTPGLIDLHTHIYWGGTSLGVDPTDYAKRCGTTTMVDAGSSGAGNFIGFRRHIIEQAEPNIFAFLNISFPGIFAFSPSVMVGECTDLQLLNSIDCLRVARQHPDLIVGVKVRVGLIASGPHGLAPLDMALEVAEELGLPVMCHLDLPPPRRLDVVERLRPGDILTHCFRPFPGGPSRGDGQVHDDILAARERGILFDIGHGAGSFGFATAEAMLANGFQPDCISSDVHAISIEGPAYDQLVTLSKFLALGVPLAEVIAASTIRPAEAIGRPHLGTLAVGSPGNATILSLETGSYTFVDSRGEERTGDHHLNLRHVILNGAHWHSAG